MIEETVSAGLRLKRIALLAVTALGLAALAPSPIHRPILVYNASASLPLGFYRTEAFEHANKGDILLLRLPKAIQDFAAARHYLPANVPLIKPVAALAGDHVCTLSGHVLINGTTFAAILDVDRLGRVLVRWKGCRRLNSDELFLLVPTEGSYDSRYFGPVRTANIIAKLVPLWVW
ncbi:MAG TPA: S26 family signal peptidase [Dongiaceae bacterium]|jgi:conjugative transfer signal peptidase TraF|nr:S26 family signal peptidase [Dongiaceae bacterium]